MIGSVKLSDLGKWPAKVAHERHGAIVNAIRVSVKTNGPAIIQAVIGGVKPYPPVNTGEYRRNWKVRNITDGVLLFNPTKQAGVIENGRRPGFGISRQGQEDLARWAHLHGMDRKPMSRRERATRRKMRTEGYGKEAFRGRIRWQQDSRARSIAFLIARAIKRRGLPAKHILAMAKPFIVMQVMRDIDMALAQKAAG